MPHALTNLIQFHLAILGRGSLPMNCSMFTCFTLLDGQIQQEHKRRASRHTQTMSAPAGNTHARACVERTTVARKAKPEQAREGTNKQPRFDRRPAFHHNGTAFETLIISDSENSINSKPSQRIGDHPVWTWPIPHEHNCDRNSHDLGLPGLKYPIIRLA